MKTLILGLIFSAFAFTARAQVPYNVVFDLTSSDTMVHKSVIRWLNGISSGKPDAKLEVVLYGQSLDMIRSGRSVVEDALKKVISNPNVKVKVCASAMKRQNVSASELIPGVETVPDGIYQIITRQSQGWGYIKAL
jgi:uncharacterized protein